MITPSQGRPRTVTLPCSTRASPRARPRRARAGRLRVAGGRGASRSGRAAGLAAADAAARRGGRATGGRVRHGGTRRGARVLGRSAREPARLRVDGREVAATGTGAEPTQVRLLDRGAQGGGAVHARAGARALRRAHAEAARQGRRRESGRPRSRPTASRSSTSPMCSATRCSSSTCAPVRARPPRARDRRTVRDRLRPRALGPVARAAGRQQARQLRRRQPPRLARDAPVDPQRARGLGRRGRR